MATLSLRSLSKYYGAVEVVRGLDLEIADRELAVFVGPSGCGKSTLLRMIAGLEEVDAGDILIDGRSVVDVPPADRGLAMVFQSYALYPHMSAFDNLAFGLRRAGLPRAEIEARISRAAALLQITPLLPRRPREMSGGQRQRVAIGRAIVREPRAFLFDEPLSNLDASLRSEMRTQILALHQRLEATMIFVTHDQVEAMTLADKIVVLNGGRIEQVGSPMEVYAAPRNLFVARFIGSPGMNLLPATVSASTPGLLAVDLTGEAAASAGRILFDRPAAAIAAGSAVTVGLRAAHFAVAGPGAPALDLSVDLVERLGDATHVHGRLGGAARVTVALEGTAPARPGDRIPLTLRPGVGHLFDAAGQAVPAAGARLEGTATSW